MLSTIIYIFIKSIYKLCKQYIEPYKYDELFDYTDTFAEDETERNNLIYPDDYPFHSDSFLGMYFPFLQFKENRIRKRLQKYLDLDMKNQYLG